jgi:DNA-binding LacI/PurR family transcriptional regulator
MNISEVARHCGVSRSTVSYALSGKRTISAETRQRILAAVDELGYQPTSGARAAKQSHTGAVGLVIPPAADHLTAMQLDFVGAVMEAAACANLDVLLSPSGGEPDGSFERIVTGRGLDGLILTEIRLEDPRVERMRRARMPFVMIGRNARAQSISWVDLDTAALVTQCVDHLAGLGHRHIALINRSTSLLMAGYAPAHRARTSFAEAAERHEIEGVEFCCGDGEVAGEICMQRILEQYPQVTAIVTVNEAALPGIRRALDRAGLEVPGHFSITGLVARHLAEQFEPRLTAFDVPAAKLGATAGKFLCQRIAKPDCAPAQELFAPPISLGESTGPAVARL